SDAYHYDPALPTPSVGGPGLLANAPVVDNGALEARADVLVYTTGPLEDDLEAIGPVSVEIWVQSSCEHFDLFARVCDVMPDGTSLNVCDAIERISPENGGNTAGDPVRVSFELWPIVHRFVAGNRIRLQVSSGAHPRYARNTGTGEDIATATRVVTSNQQVLQGPDHPSAVVLPVVD
ncbi:MAG: CocE/NonD family hydrolase, partial [Acidobacteriota bacterium]